jgi:hypothetical protein
MARVDEVRQLSPLAQLGAYGPRFNDNTNKYEGAGMKGDGWLGTIPLSNGDVATEYSSADKFGTNRYIGFPTVVPTLTPMELMRLKQAAASHAQVPNDVYEKARDFAQQRLNMGLSPFVE